MIRWLFWTLLWGPLQRAERRQMKYWRTQERRYNSFVD